jgi:hypothetical protein
LHSVCSFIQQPEYSVGQPSFGSKGHGVDLDLPALVIQPVVNDDNGSNAR